MNDLRDSFVHGQLTTGFKIIGAFHTSLYYRLLKDVDYTNVKAVFVMRNFPIDGSKGKIEFSNELVLALSYNQKQNKYTS